jgi:hypothetical protein
MSNRSACVGICFASLLALTQLIAQTQPQSRLAAAAVAQQPTSEALEGAVPRLIRFSGTLSAAEVKQGGLVGVEFAIYQEESGGIALWSEIQNVEADSSGHFGVVLGATKNGGLPPDVLGIGEQRWLSVTPVGGVAQPRALLVSVPYALRAEEAMRIAGVPAGEFVRKGDLTDSVREAMHTMQSDGTTSNAIPNANSGPTTFSGSTTNQIVSVKQTGSGKAIVATAASAIATVSTGGIAGVYGSATAAAGIGVQGVATSTAGGKSTGVSGISSSAAGTGVSGQGSAFGVTGTAANAGGIGVRGTSTDISDITGIDFGVQGIASDSTGAGVNGTNKALTGNAFGVSGNSSSTSTKAAAVNGSEGASTGQVYGVNGNTSSTGPFAAGVNGYEGANTGQVSGVSGFAQSAGQGSAGVAGVEEATTGQVFGVSGGTPSTTTNAAGVNGYEGAATGTVFGVNGNTSSAGPGAAGVNGFEGATTGQVFGVNGSTLSNGTGSAGVIGFEGSTTGNVFGVNGSTTSSGNGSAGVFGNAEATTGSVYGVNGISQSPNGFGVFGNNTATSGPAVGVGGSSISPNGSGVSGSSPNIAVVGYNQNCNSNGCTPGTGIGGQFFTAAGGTLLQGLSGPSFSSLTPVFTVDGTGKGTFNGGVSSTINNPNGNAIVATNNATSGSAAALVGISYSSSAAGIAGYNYSTSGGGGLYGESHSASAAAIFGANMGGGLGGSFSGGVFVSGNLNVTGTITAGTKDFKIDDPIDPERKFLYHASIESWEMANLYSGNVVLDRRGEAVVDLPEWFEALNRDFRYQLTTIGRAAQVYIAKEIENHRFKIAGGRAGMKVSWQVTGVRHDAWAQSHPLQVEEEKLEH